MLASQFPEMVRFDWEKNTTYRQMTTWRVLSLFSDVPLIARGNPYRPKVRKIEGPIDRLIEKDPIDQGSERPIIEKGPIDRWSDRPIIDNYP